MIAYLSNTYTFLGSRDVGTGCLNKDLRRSTAICFRLCDWTNESTAKRFANIRLVISKLAHEWQVQGQESSCRRLPHWHRMLWADPYCHISYKLWVLVFIITLHSACCKAGISQACSHTVRSFLHCHTSMVVCSSCDHSVAISTVTLAGFITCSIKYLSASF